MLIFIFLNIDIYDHYIYINKTVKDSIRLTRVWPFGTWNREKNSLTYTFINKVKTNHFIKVIQSFNLRDISEHHLPWKFFILWTFVGNIFFHLSESETQIVTSKLLRYTLHATRLLLYRSYHAVPEGKSAAAARWVWSLGSASWSPRWSWGEQLELNAPERLPSHRLLYPCCHFDCSSHWRQSNNKNQPPSGHQRVTSQLRQPHPREATHLGLELAVDKARMHAGNADWDGTCAGVVVWRPWKLPCLSWALSF